MSLWMPGVGAGEGVICGEVGGEIEVGGGEIGGSGGGQGEVAGRFRESGEGGRRKS